MGQSFPNGLDYRQHGLALQKNRTELAKTRREAMKSAPRDYEAEAGLIEDFQQAGQTRKSGWRALLDGMASGLKYTLKSAEGEKKRAAYANMEKLDNSLNEAAADLGSKPTNTFFTVTLPLTMPGIIAGSLLVFIPATGEYVIPDLLGGGNVQMIGRVLFNEFSRNTDWPVASAVAMVLLLLLVLPMIIFQYYQGKEAEAQK